MAKANTSRITNLTVGLDRHPEIAAEVGKIIAQWNGLEHVLSAVILAKFVNSDPSTAAKIMYAFNSNTARLEMLDSLGSHIVGSSGVSALFKETMKVVRSAWKIRSHYAHAIYVVTVRARWACLSRWGGRQ